MAHSDHGGHTAHHGGMHGDGIMENHGYVQSTMNEGAVSQPHGDMGHASHTGMSAASNFGMPHMMTMTFHGGFNETILFEQWNISSAGGLVGSFIAIFIVALVYEGLKYYRKHLLWQTYSGLQYCAVSAPDKATAPDDPHIHQSTRSHGGKKNADDDERAARVADAAARGAGARQLHAHARVHDLQPVAVRRCRARLRHRLLPVRLAGVRRRGLHRALPLTNGPHVKWCALLSSPPTLPTRLTESAARYRRLAMGDCNKKNNQRWKNNKNNRIELQSHTMRDAGGGAPRLAHPIASLNNFVFGRVKCFVVVNALLVDCTRSHVSPFAQENIDSARNGESWHVALCNNRIV